jgi:hypothetical protein
MKNSRTELRNELGVIFLWRRLFDIFRQYLLNV